MIDELEIKKILGLTTEEKIELENLEVKKWQYWSDWKDPS